MKSLWNVSETSPKESNKYLYIFHEKLFDTSSLNDTLGIPALAVPSYLHNV